VLTVAFDYVNGFHDTATSIATSVATRALRPQYALLMATAFNFIGTMGHRVAVLEPVHGFAAQTTTATVMFAAAHLGMPVSTTQVMASGIMGVGASQGVKRVRWGVARRILVAWTLTLPATAIVGVLSWTVLTAIGLR
jgi:PiT family inorganic phosphate transporter